MNEEMQLKVLEYLQGIESRIGKAEGFVLEQSPLYVQELVSWYFCFYVAMCCVSFLAFVFVVVFARCIYNIKEDHGVNWRGEGVFIGVLGGILMLTICIASGMSAVKVYVAPRVVIVEHLKESLK